MTARYSAEDNCLVLPGGEKIKCFPECKGLWKGNQYVQEGIDYQLKQVPCPYFDHIDDPVEYSTEAFPLVPVKGEDELWDDVVNVLSPDYYDTEKVDQLKQKYSLSRKQ